MYTRETATRCEMTVMHPDTQRARRRESQAYDDEISVRCEKSLAERLTARL